ncbi:uncharacterized protein LOC143036967 [Oratosquilla oratoria]|uniref:uncharacterized protein LOC143036967 n=1 Tax=Oratosquilla oratoria TaxID=337810 RepID=UPI003F762B18
MGGASNVKSPVDLLAVGVGALLLLAVTTRLPSCEAQEKDFEYPALAEEDVAYPYYEDDHHDYVLHDEVFRNAAAESAIRKCRCGASQAVTSDGSGCQEADTWEGVSYADGKIMGLDTKDWGNVTVAPLQCPSTKVHYTVPKDQDFYLLLTGEVYIPHLHLAFGLEDYCLEHVLEDASRFGWEVQVCLPMPRVPRCCPQGQTHILKEEEGAGSYSCEDHEHKDTTFTPQVLLGVETLRIDVVVDLADVPVECDSQETMMTKALDSVRTHLIYSSNGTQLYQNSLDLLLPFESYCLSQKAEEEYEVLFCYRDRLKEHDTLCAGGPCVRKCCPKNKIFRGISCADLEEEEVEWRPTFEGVGEGEDPPKYNLVEGFPLCRDFYELQPTQSEVDRYTLLQNGSIFLPAVNRSFPATRYCMDHKTTNGTTVEPLALFCFHEHPVAAVTGCDVTSTTIYPIAMIISCLFLFVTLAVYISLPDLRERIHGKCLVSHVSALLVAYVTLIVTQLGIKSLSMNLCIANGVILHFCFLAAFFWLNVMCFDIFWTLKSLNPVPDRTEQVRLRFKLYSMYAWGCPLTLSLLVITMQFLPGDDVGIIRPGLGHKSCWFGSPTALWIYFYSFVTVLVTLNLFCFVGVGCILYSLQNTCGSTLGREKELERLWLYVKLFAVMGITWVTEVISYQVGGCYVWIPTDITNALQGFIIFLIFICKRNILRKLQQRYGSRMFCFKDLMQPNRRTGQAARTPTPQHVPSSYSSDGRGSQSSASQRTTQTIVNQSSIKQAGSNGTLAPAPDGPLTTAMPLTTFSSTAPGTRTISSNSLPLNSISENDDVPETCPTEVKPVAQVQKERAKPTFSLPESLGEDSPQVVRLKVTYGPETRNREDPNIVRVDTSTGGPEVKVQDDPQEEKTDASEPEDQSNPQGQNEAIPDVVRGSNITPETKHCDVEAGGLSPDDLEGPDFTVTRNHDTDDNTASDA